MEALEYLVSQRQAVKMLMGADPTMKRTAAYRRLDAVPSITLLDAKAYRGVDVALLCAKVTENRRESGDAS